MTRTFVWYIEKFVNLRVALTGSLKSDWIHKLIIQCYLWTRSLKKKNHHQRNIHPCIRQLLSGLGAGFKKRNGLFFWNVGLYLTTISMLPKMVEVGPLVYVSSITPLSHFKCFDLILVKITYYIIALFILLPGRLIWTL